MSRSHVRSAAAVLGLLALVASACGDDRATTRSVSATTTTTSTARLGPVIDPGDGGDYDPQLDPADFVDVIDNPYLPMPVGAHWRYQGESDGEVETVDITVTGERRQVMGISAFVIRDTVTVGGQMVEDTLDWFAQDVAGNVWYLGEDVKDYDGGQVVSTAGSWEAGVGGARPGIVMPAAPEVGEVHRQEYLPGEAEDMMEVLDVGAALDVAAGQYREVVVTRDWTPLDPDTVEEKHYARGVGKIREEKVAGGGGFVELIEVTFGS